MCPTKSCSTQLSVLRQRFRMHSSARYYRKFPPRIEIIIKKSTGTKCCSARLLYDNRSAWASENEPCHQKLSLDMWAFMKAEGSAKDADAKHVYDNCMLQPDMGLVELITHKVRAKLKSEQEFVRIGSTRVSPANLNTLVAIWLMRLAFRTCVVLWFQSHTQYCLVVIDLGVTLPGQINVSSSCCSYR